MTQAHPLHWPDGWPRTDPWKRTFHPLFTHGIARAFQDLRWEIERLGGKNIVISSNLQMRQDGTAPLAGQSQPDDPGVAAYFTLDDQPMTMAHDRWAKAEHNARSLFLAIEGMRQMQRHGGGHMVKRAFSGFAALPPPGAKPWWDVLGIPRDTRDRKTILAAYQALAKERHPDAGGSDAAMAELNAARDAAMKETEHGV